MSDKYVGGAVLLPNAVDEDDVSFRFERSRAGVTMTLAGTAFIRGAKPMVATADKLVAMMRAAGQGRAGGLMLGQNNSVSAGNLRATLMSWHEAHPAVDVECVEADRSVLLAGLDTGEIDIAILMSVAGQDGIHCEPLWSERMLVALPASHPLAERDVVHRTDLRSERFLLPVADPCPEIRDMLLGRLAVSGVKPDIRLLQARLVAGLRAGRARMTGRSSSPMTGRSRFQSTTPSCARSKAICSKSWTSCSDRCREVRWSIISKRGCLTRRGSKL